MLDEWIGAYGQCDERSGMQWLFLEGSAVCSADTKLTIEERAVKSTGQVFVASTKIDREQVMWRTTSYIQSFIIEFICEYRLLVCLHKNGE